MEGNPTPSHVYFQVCFLFLFKSINSEAFYSLTKHLLINCYVQCSGAFSPKYFKLE